MHAIFLTYLLWVEIMKQTNRFAAMVAMGLFLAAAGSAQILDKPRLRQKVEPVKLTITSSSRIMLERFNNGEYHLSGHVVVMVGDNRVSNAVVTMNGMQLEYKLLYYRLYIKNYAAAPGKEIRIRIRWPVPGTFPLQRYMTVTASQAPGILLNVTHPANGSMINPAGSQKLKITWTDPGMPAWFSLYTPLGGHTLVFRDENVTGPSVFVPVALLKPGTQYENVLRIQQNMPLTGPVTAGSVLRFEQHVRSVFHTAARKVRL